MYDPAFELKELFDASIAAAAQAANENAPPAGLKTISPPTPKATEVFWKLNVPVSAIIRLPVILTGELDGLRFSVLPLPITKLPRIFQIVLPTLLRVIVAPGWPKRGGVFKVTPVPCTAKAR